MSLLNSGSRRRYRKPTLTAYGLVEEITQGAQNNPTDAALTGSTFVSGRHVKEVAAPADSSDVLRRLAALPISVWTYREGGESTRHIGPMAQDFAAAFGMGQSDRYINSIDAIGVTMAAVQALAVQVRERDDRIDQLAAEVQALKARRVEDDA